MFANFFRFLIYSLLFFFAYRIFRFFIPKKGSTNRETVERDRDGVDDVMVQDPACGVYLPRRDAVKRRIKGETHYFCSERCAEDFRKGIAKERASKTVEVRE